MSTVTATGRYVATGDLTHLGCSTEPRCYCKAASRGVTSPDSGGRPLLRRSLPSHWRCLSVRVAVTQTCPRKPASTCEKVVQLFSRASAAALWCAKGSPVIRHQLRIGEQTAVATKDHTKGVSRSSSSDSEAARTRPSRGDARPRDARVGRNVRTIRRSLARRLCLTSGFVPIPLGFIQRTALPDLPGLCEERAFGIRRASRGLRAQCP